LVAYASRGYVDFYEVNYKPLTSIFGNFHPCRLSMAIGGQNYTFQCSEAAFQAHKFEGRPDLIKQFENLDGDGAWRKANDLTQPWKQAQRDAWRQKNIPPMKAVLLAKFTQNPQLGQLLLATGPGILIEHTPLNRDRFWGDNGNGSGTNKLGELLMELRTRLGGPQIDFSRINYRSISAKL